MRPIIACTLALFAGPALGHVTLAETQAPSDSYYKATLRVPHGCKGAPTIRIRMRIPEGVSSVKPQPKQGWKLDILRRGSEVREVAWSGGPLADEHFDEFQAMMKLPARVGTVYFPVVQECTQGVHRWIEIPPAGKSAHEVKEPAPALTLTPRQ